MQVYVLSLDYQTLKETETIVGGFSNCSVQCFADVRMLRQTMEEKPPDVLFLDVETRSLAPMVEALAKCRKTAKVILMSDSDSYAAEAFEIGAYGYLVKPVSEEKLKKQLRQIQHPILSKLESSKDRRHR